MALRVRAAIYWSIAGLRPDVRIVDVNLIRRHWYVEYLNRTMPQHMAQRRR